MSKVFFTADLHFGHKNIISYCNRPFSSVETMNDTIIERWNSKVGVDDTVFILGDFLLIRDEDTKRALDVIFSLNGKIMLVPGNHEKMALHCSRIITNGKMVVLPELYAYYHQDANAPKGRRLIVLCHYAMRVWEDSHFGSYHLYGHSHGTLPDDKTSLSMDVGVDPNNFYPLSYEEIVDIMGKKSYTPLKHNDNKRSYEETKTYYEKNSTI